MLESFSRTVRNYVPSSIPIPKAGPAPPHVSRPISVGSFMPSTLLSTSPASPAAFKRRGSNGINTNDWRARNAGQFGMDDVFGSDEEEAVDVTPARGQRAYSNTSYPGVADGDPILWSRWDQLRDDCKLERRLLFLGYSIGLQIWDCTNLGSVSEILNLSSPEWGHITFAGVLPAPPPSEVDPFVSQRPLIGTMYVLSQISRCLCELTHLRSTRNRDDFSFAVYSLRAHNIVKSLTIPGFLHSFSSNSRFIVIVRSTRPLK